MSAYGDWALGFRSNLLAGYGKVVLLRRTTSVGTTSPAINPVSVAVTVAAAASAGVSTLDMTAPPPGNWLLLAGDTFTVGADTTVYTVTAQISSVSGKFTGVAFTPVLSVNAALNAAVNFVWKNDISAPARVRNYSANLVNGTTVTTKDLRVFMSVLSVPDVNGARSAVPLPSTLDRLFIDGLQRTIIAAVPVYAADTVIDYDIQARA